MVRAAVLAACLWACAATAVPACEAVTSGHGLPGRFAEIGFDNSIPSGGRHENWAPRGTRLVMHAGFEVLTDEYDHGILGAVEDAKALTIHVRRPGDDRISCPTGVVLPAGEVFEDIAPRLADLDADGLPEVIVVHTDARKGARLAVYDRRGNLRAATPHIGRPHRWMAPAAIGDLDGDGRIEIAVVDRPHLARVLRVWRFADDRLLPVATAEGLTNHRIGDAFISGGLRACAGEPVEILLASADWTRLRAVRLLRDGTLRVRDAGPLPAAGVLPDSLGCR